MITRVWKPTELFVRQVEKNKNFVREELAPKIEKSLKEAGGENVLNLTSYSHASLGILKFPDLDAWEKYRLAVFSPQGGLGIAAYMDFDIELCRKKD